MNSVDQDCWTLLLDEGVKLDCEAVKVGVEDGVEVDES